MQKNNRKNIYTESFFSGLKPDPILTVSEWADRHRMLSSKSASEPGQWRTSRTPYLREIMDTLSATDRTQYVVFQKGAQIGGTEAGNNWLGYIIDYAPGPVMAVQPTVEMAKRASKQRLAPLIEESPRLRSKVKDARARDSGNTILQKEFPGGVMILTGANSAVGLRSMPVRFLFLDEPDGYPGDVDGEGDPVALAIARTRTFSRRKIFLCSTPTIEGRSQIAAYFEKSDRRFFWVPCPRCGEFQVLRWRQVKWPEGKPKDARYICEHCEGEIENWEKTKMLEAGYWEKENPDSDIAGFHLSSLYSPVGWISWGELAEQWVAAKGNNEKLRGFINTVLGEPWKDKGEAPEWRRLYDRREPYQVNVVPEGAAFLTAGVDVQKDRLEVQVVAWGREKESWSIDYRVYPGDTSDLASQCWRDLADMVYESWPHETKQVQMPLKLMAIDSGYNTQVVYSWCRQFSLTQVIAIKGQETLQLPIGQPRAVDVTLRGKTVRKGLKVWPVGVNMLKSETYGFLRQDPPIDPGEPIPHGYCHFPEYGEEFFKQLTAEELVVKLIRGYSRYEWQKTRDRNEVLDTRIYARAAASVCGIDRFREAHWKKLEQDMGAVRARPGEDKPAKPARKLRRRRSSFL